MRRKDEIQTLLQAKQREIHALQAKMDSFEASMDDDTFEFVLTESYGQVSVCGYEYASGALLREIDPIAFNCGKNDYLDSCEKEEFEEFREMRDELENLECELSDLEAELDELEGDENE